MFSGPAAGGVKETVKISSPGILGGPVMVVKEEVVREYFPHPQQLPQAFSVPRIRNGEIEQFQSPFESPHADIGFSFPSPADCPFQLASHVGHLLDK